MPSRRSRLLTGDDDETEIADRGAVGLRVAVDDDDAQAPPRCGKGMGEADDAGPDDGEVAGHHDRLTTAARTS